MLCFNNTLLWWIFGNPGAKKIGPPQNYFEVIICSMHKLIKDLYHDGFFIFSQPLVIKWRKIFTLNFFTSCRRKFVWFTKPLPQIITVLVEIPTQYQPRQVLLQSFPSSAPEYPLVITRLQLQLRIELRVRQPIMSARVRQVRAKILD